MTEVDKERRKARKKAKKDKAAAVEGVPDASGAGKHEDKNRSSAVAPVAADSAARAATVEIRDAVSKKKRKKRELAIEADRDTDDNAAEEPADAAALRKAQKKEKKRRRKEAEASQPAPAGLDVAAASPDAAHAAKSVSKAAKKGKKAAQAQNGASAALAAVGNVDLARSAPPIIKGVYTQHPELSSMTDAEVAAFLNERGIVVEGSDLRPMTQFGHLGFDKKLLHAVASFAVPSPIQAQCWPIVLSGRDLIGIAATGSGKTLAFGLPALRHIQEQRERGVVSGSGSGTPNCVCVAPTRELAQQIASVLADAGSKCGCAAVCVYGGHPKHVQAKELRAGVQIVVGTPGRMVDFLEEGTLKLHVRIVERCADILEAYKRMQEVTYLVLDEADRMLDLGFEPEIRKIAAPIRADRQTLMFSATWPPSIQKLAMEFLVDPVKVTIGSQELAASHSVTQTVEVIDEFARNDRLVQLLQKHHKSRKNRILIFVLYKKEAPRIEQLLQRKGFTAAAVHGDISQDARNKAVEGFKSGAVPLLIATDVAARGLDIPDVEMVINFSFPLTVEDYVHRIGRTGRAGKAGISHTFFVGKNDKPKAGELVNVLREAGSEVPKELMGFGTAVKKKESKLYGAHFKDVDLSVKASKVKFDSDDE